MFDGLMRGPIFSNTNRVVTKDEHTFGSTQSCKTYGGAHVVRKDKEGSDHWKSSAMQSQTNGNGPHSVFANPVVNLS